MELQFNTDERREKIKKAATIIAKSDREIEEILTEHNDELDAFNYCESLPFANVRRLVAFEQARHYALMYQAEVGHGDCERENIEKVETWGYAIVMALVIGAAVLAIIGLIKVFPW